mmetsp:Transcript_26799/g.55439  ORF Transcript_26799/g.55439 Transcript_26799/m.55439 type:complete len:87 (+) Transcript_26799:290-550(+)
MEWSLPVVALPASANINGRGITLWRAGVVLLELFTLLAFLQMAKCYSNGGWSSSGSSRSSISRETVSNGRTLISNGPLWECGLLLH